MKGYIFEYYKYVRYHGETMQDIRECLDYEEAKHSILTFGEYDRLKINNIVDFERYRDLSSLAKAWVGNRQSFRLYDYFENSEFVYEEDKGFKEKKSGKYDCHLFWALTEFSFCSNLRKLMESYDQLLCETANQIKNIVNDFYKKDINYMILGTLGTFGVAVLWFSNQYTEVLRLVDVIKRKSRYKKSRMYLAAHTLFSRNPMYDPLSGGNNTAAARQLINEIKGEALVQITLKRWINNEITFKGQVQKIRHTSGEYDIALEMDAKDVYVLFENNEYFNHDSDKYQKNILQTRVTLADNSKMYLPDQPEEDLSEELNEETEALVYNLKQIEKTYGKLRAEIEKRIDKTAGMVDTLDSLYCDYRYNVASAVNQNWADDFSYIFNVNLKCIEDILVLEKASNDDVMFILRLIMNNLKQQIFHISEANNLNIELPKCHLRYTGQEDCILFAYMGIIKEILKTAYQLKSYNMQTEIIPILTVDVVPIIESELYFDRSSYVNSQQKDQDFKILSLNLPHVTFYEIPLYMKYLYHEIYHYIVPENREQRDYVMGVLLSSIYFYDVLREELLNLFQQNDELSRSIVNYFRPAIYDIVKENYMDMHTALTGFVTGEWKTNTDVVLLIANIYKNCIINHLENEKSTLVLWIEKIYVRLINQSVEQISFERLLSYLQKDDQMPDANKIIKKIQEWMGKIIEKKIPLNSGNEERRSLLDKIMDGIEEVSADVPMIELTEMPLEEYMLLYVFCLNNEMQNPNAMSKSDEFKEVVRVGVILHFYEKKGRTLENVQNEFIYLYLAQYINLTKDSVGEVLEKLNKRKKEAEKWFNYFKECRSTYLSQFGIFKSALSVLAEMASVKERVVNYDISQSCQKYFQNYREIYKNFIKGIKGIESNIKQKEEEDIHECCEKLEGELHEAVFAENIRFVHLFQSQIALTELHKINEEHNNKKAKNCIRYDKSIDIKDIVKENCEQIFTKTEIRSIYGLEGLLREVNQITRELERSCCSVFGRGKYSLWYRGQENSEYGLLPNIMRKNSEERLRFHYLSQCQRYLFEEFKFRADGAPEIMDKSHYCISDYLALMQHYEVHTNLMDWSEDVFTSLYFALEKLINNERSKMETDAAIFIFSPHLYNDARNYMIEEAAKKTACTEKAYLASRKTVDSSDGLIPNIGVKYNESVYDMFLTGNLDYESENMLGYEREIELIGKEEIAYLPIAIYTSRLNPRIRSQSGIFVAYNLYAEPSKDIDSYGYLELEKIQNYYMQKCTRNGKKKFLYKIIIDRVGAVQIAESLRRMGISRERIYPELNNIGKKIK